MPNLPFDCTSTWQGVIYSNFGEDCTDTKGKWCTHVQWPHNRFMTFRTECYFPHKWHLHLLPSADTTQDTSMIFFNALEILRWYHDDIFRYHLVKLLHIYKHDEIFDWISIFFSFFSYVLFAAPIFLVEIQWNLASLGIAGCNRAHNRAHGCDSSKLCSFWT